MFCKECGKVIPDGAKRCSFCGAEIRPSGPRHARPEADEELYSYSDRHLSDDRDSTRIYDPAHESFDETKVYPLGAFDDGGMDPGDGYGDYGNDFDPNYDPGYDPNYGPGPMGPDDPETIGDDYEHYMDGQDDDTFMDKIDNRFRRDDDDYRRPKKSKAWIWITIIIVAVILIIVALVFAFSGKLFGNKNKTPTTVPKATVTATVKPTQAPAPTQPPAPTDPPATQPPATEPPAPTQPPAPDPPITQAPEPTQPPATQAPAPTEAVTLSSE